MSTATMRSSGNIGDIHAAIPAMKEFYRATGKKIILYLVNGQRAEYYEGQHTYKK